MDNEKTVEVPADGSKDCLGREFSDICGYSGALKTTPIPVGSIVRVLPDRYPRVSLRDPLFVGELCVVLDFSAARRAANGYRELWEEDQALVRRITPVSQWDYVSDSILKIDAAWLEIVTLGDGTVKEGSYQKSEKEIWTERFNVRDHSFEGYSNPPTFLAALYLENEPVCQTQLARMVRADGTINPRRIEKLFRDQKLVIDEWAWYPEEFPHRSEFKYWVNWTEVGDYFIQKFKELSAARGEAA
jgi:hypothetical protein